MGGSQSAWRSSERSRWGRFAVVAQWASVHDECDRPKWGQAMVEDLNELGKLTDVNLACAWANIGGHGGEVGGSPECPFVATGLPAAFFNGV